MIEYLSGSVFNLCENRCLYLWRWLCHAAILQREVVEKKGWATEEELTDYFAIGQCTPGIIAVNTATFIGHKYKGVLGGILATLGVVFPSLIIITIIAAFLKNFAEYPVVAHALAGINAAVVALIAVSVFKLGKSTLKGKIAPWIFVGVLLLAQGGGLFSDSLALTGVAASIVSTITSPAVLVVLSGVLGWFLFYPRKEGKGGEKA